jgi:hypothetical protein
MALLALLRKREGPEAMANDKNSAKVLAERPVRGPRAGTIQHSVGYELGEDGMVSKVARKGNANYMPSDRFPSENPDYQSGITQNVGTPAHGDALRNAISHIRGK